MSLFRLNMSKQRIDSERTASWARGMVKRAFVEWELLRPSPQHLLGFRACMWTRAERYALECSRQLILEGSERVYLRCTYVPTSQPMTVTR